MIIEVGEKMGLENLFYDNVPEDDGWHIMELSVKINDGHIIIEGTTHGIIVDGKRVD